MKKVILMGATTLLSLLTGLTLASAANTTYPIKDGNGSPRTVEAFACGTDGNGQPIICPGYTPQDLSGNQLGVAGNPFAISFGTGVQLPGFATPPAVNLQDGSGNALTSTDGALNVNCPGCSGGGGGTANQGSAATVSSAWPVKTTDGTNTAAVKPASTAPAATDPAAVVAVSPNGNQSTAANQTNGTQKSQQVDGSGNVQPSGDVASRALFQKLTDGTNGPVAVKPASTAAAATDPAEVVAISPNNTLPLSASGGWTPTLFAALGTTVKTVKSSAGQVGKLYCDNPNASAIYVETFDVSGTVTLGTTAPTQAYYLPATSASGFSIPVQGDQYLNAIKIAAVTSYNGTTAPTTPGNCNISWK